MNKQKKKVYILAAFVILAALAYLSINVDPKHIDYAMSIRTPKLIVMGIAAFCIGSASIIFQTIINNTIVTPCLLGINSLYVLVNTLVVYFLGSSSFLVVNKELSFLIDLAIMSFAAVIIYGIFFEKTKGNILYILLTGTVMATLFGSITSTLQRMIDPNEFVSLQTALIASFDKVNEEIIVFAIVAIIGVIIYLRKELMLLDVLVLGKNQAINLGLDYDKTVRKLMIGVTLLISIATAVVGPISFLGLIIANLARQLFKTYRHNYLIAGSCLIGIFVLVTGQLLIEHVFSFSTNISVFINIGGGIYFLYLLLRNRG